MATHLRNSVPLALVLAGALAAQDAPPQGFSLLFNGRNLDGWWGRGTADPRELLGLDAEARRALAEESLDDIREHWSVEDGVLVNDGHGLYLTTERDYGDFELYVDYRTVAKADSGIYLRGIPQVQIWDFTEAGGKWKHGADKGSGGLWNNSKGAVGKDPAVLADRPFGEWNRFRIHMVGEFVTVDLNGERVVDGARLENYFDRSRPIPRVGPIQLQTHGGEIRWRNLFIREIGADEAREYLASRDGERFEILFDGSGLDGWRGAVDDYEVTAEGTLRCKPGRGGVLFTAEEYGDFVVELEFRLPPGGNNGLAIRYPGAGSGAYDGMCELQVLEDTHEKYAKLDARQFHGSAYAMVPAARGCQRPVGEWNFQRVEVAGSRIRVELNGFRILDTDLSDVTEFMGGRPHPGKDRTRGHFGFCGHNDPVEFRDVRLRALTD